MRSATQGRDAGVAAVINASGAGVVTLDEVAYKQIFNKIVAATGLHSRWVKARSPFSIGILSKYPIRSCTTYVQPPIVNAAYRCRINIRGTNWWIFGTHLSSGSEMIRSKEIALIIEQMKATMLAHPRAPVVLAGDLNAQTPGEDNHRTPPLVIPMLQDAGFIDAYRELWSSEQDPGFTVTPPPWGHWERRIDYVFHSANSRAVAARVISSVKGYSWPSDHAALSVKLINRRTKFAGR